VALTFSRVIEVEPVFANTVTTPPYSFFSPYICGVRRPANGNNLDYRMDVRTNVPILYNVAMIQSNKAASHYNTGDVKSEAIKVEMPVTVVFEPATDEVSCSSSHQCDANFVLSVSDTGGIG
jgi:hypothetical protein